MIASISKIENCSEFLYCGFHCNNICSIYQLSIFQCMKECSLPTSKQSSWNNTIHFRIPCQECCITVWWCVHYVSFEFFSMVIKDSGLLVCVTTLMGKWFLTFWRMFGLLGLMVHGPWSFGDEGDLSFQNIRNQLFSDTVSHFRILESLHTLLYWKYVKLHYFQKVQGSNDDLQRIKYCILKRESHYTGHNIGMGRKNDAYEGLPLVN